MRSYHFRVTSGGDDRGETAASPAGYADSAGVRIHYFVHGATPASAATGIAAAAAASAEPASPSDASAPAAAASAADRPMIVCLHGFPDDSRTWRPILPRLAERFVVVTPDLRGYTRSDKPDGVGNYTLDKLAGDVVALIDHFGRERVIVLGHDWGAAIAQHVALRHRRRVERLILLNMPHLNGLQRELATNPRQQKASAYARLLQNEIQLGPYDLDTLKRQMRGGSRERSVRTTLDVLRRSDFNALLNYYRANYPRPPYRLERPSPLSVIRVPTLIVFGLDDPYVLADGLRDNDRWFSEPLRVVTVPRAGHWVHHDEPDLVAETILQWLDALAT